LQAEDFDNGGQNVSYFDSEATNLGWSPYRKGMGVDVTDGLKGTRFVGCIKAGEWMEYTVNVATAGTYAFSARVASLKAGGTFHVEVDGVNKTGTMSVGDTGGWQNWINVSAKSGVTLSAGTHVIRFKADAAGSLGYVANVDSFTFAPVTSAFSTVRATWFTAVSKVLVTPGYLAQLDKGDWVAFGRLDFGAGAKSVTASVAAPASAAGKKIEVRLDSVTGRVVATITVPATGAWTTFKTVSAAVAAGTAGIHDVYLTFPTGNATANLQSIRFA
jgi:hypothetical protein